MYHFLCLFLLSNNFQDYLKSWGKFWSLTIQLYFCYCCRLLLVLLSSARGREGSVYTHFVSWRKSCNTYNLFFWITGLFNVNSVIPFEDAFDLFLNYFSSILHLVKASPFVYQLGRIPVDTQHCFALQDQLISLSVCLLPFEMISSQKTGNKLQATSEIKTGNLDNWFRAWEYKAANRYTSDIVQARAEDQGLTFRWVRGAVGKRCINWDARRGS